MTFVCFRLALTELFGGEIYLDLVFDPAYYVFSMARVGLSYHYGNQKYNLLELTIHSQGKYNLFTWMFGWSVFLWQILNVFHAFFSPVEDSVMEFHKWNHEF